jgi:hypothetical protein
VRSGPGPQSQLRGPPVVAFDGPFFHEHGTRWARERVRSVLYPSPVQIELRNTVTRTLFQVTCELFRFCVESFDFDAITIVDSDQLLVKRGFSDLVLEELRREPSCGLLGSSQAGVRQEPGGGQYLAEKAHRERGLWEPLLRRFPNGDDAFVYFTFWPGLVVAGPAVRDVVVCVDSVVEVETLSERTTISGLEEVLLPTLIRLLGWETRPSPASFRYCKFRDEVTLAELEQARLAPDCFWVHPVPRVLDDPIRRTIRAWHGSYR